VSGLLRRTLLGVLVATVTTHLVADDNCKLTPVASLPLQILEGEPVIPAAVEGKAIEMSIDTGGSFSTLSSQLVAALNLPTKPIRTVKITEFGGAQAGTYVVPHAFALDRLVSDKQEFVVANYSPISAGGTIGPDMLRAFDLDFDFGNAKFNLISQDHCTGRVTYWSDEAARIPITIDDWGHIRFTLMIDGKEFSALLDTGATSSTLNLESAQSQFGFQTNDPAIKPAGMINGTIPYYHYPFKNLTLGGLSVTNPRILLVSDKDSKIDDLPNVVLGMDVLSRLHLYVAYSEKAIYLTAASAK
jgi:predicted aspartyl protease